jgi:hypothetical protein
MVVSLTALTDPAYARIRLTVAGAVGTEVNINRVDPVTNNLIPVRNADPLVPISGGGEVYDYEAPLNVPITYQITDNGATTSISPVTLAVTIAWLKSPAFPTLNQNIKLRAMPKLSRQRPMGVHNVLHRSKPIVTYGTLSGATGSMTLLTGNEAATDAMLEFLQATGVAYLQIPGSRFSETYFALGDLDEEPLTRSQYEDSVDWTVEIIEVDRPEGGFEGNPTSTYDSLRDGTITNYTNLKTVKTSYLAVMRGSGVPTVPPNPGSF